MPSRPKVDPFDLYNQVLGIKAQHPDPEDFARELVRRVKEAGLVATIERGSTTGTVEYVRFSTGHAATYNAQTKSWNFSASGKPS
jgi:hypothetical protein